MHRLRNRHLLGVDLLSIPLTVYASFVLRLDALHLGGHAAGLLLLAGLSTLIIPLLLFQASLYQHAWRYVSTDELIDLVRAVSLGVLIVGALAYVVGLLAPALRIPRSIPLILLPLAVGAVSAPRLSLRIWGRRMRRRGSSGALVAPVLVMGAGDAGALVVRELLHNPQLGRRVVGLLDDDPRKLGLTIHGAPVLGDRAAISALAERHGVRQVIIAMPAAPGREIRAILQICQQASLQTMTVPGLYELLDGTLKVSQLRNIEITDLLRRAPVEIDLASVRQLIAGQTVLVTGGGGSIGSEICRQIMRCGPAELVILGHGENSIFEIQHELLRIAGQQPDAPQISTAIADIRDSVRMRTLIWHYRPSIVFHAAAHKHVPLMELNLAEAVSNNVLGTRNLLEAVMEAGVERFVMISSDKAVNPTSVMGATKRLAEMLVHRAARLSQRPYVAVRFGNVLGSRGSVILTFKRQIAAGGPITVTDPEMRRYFMTIPEAVQLVMQAAALGRQGEVFLLDMGEPVKVVDLARDMIRLSGLEEGRDIDLVYTGMRPGEKLFEELFARGESYRPTSHGKVFIADNASSCVPDNLMAAIAQLEHAVQTANEPELRRHIQQLVPEYQPPGPLYVQEAPPRLPRPLAVPNHG